MNDFELEVTMQIDDNTKDLILKEFGYVRCFYCGALIVPETRYFETKNVKTGSMAIMCQDCLKRCGKLYVTKKGGLNG